MLKLRTDLPTVETAPALERDLWRDRIFNEDCIEGLRRVPDNIAHLILSDIPYGIGADDWDVLHDNTNSAYLGTSPAQEKAGKVFKSRGKPINGWSEADRLIPKQYYDWCSTWASDWLRVVKPGGSAIVFAGRRYAHRCIAALEDAGFTFKDMLAWERDRAMHRAHLQNALPLCGEGGQRLIFRSLDGFEVGDFFVLPKPRNARVSIEHSPIDLVPIRHRFLPWIQGRGTFQDAV